MRTPYTIKTRSRTAGRALSAAAIAGLLASSLLGQPAAAAAAGSDQPSGWAQQEVDEAYAAGLVPYSLMNGYQKPISRAEMSQILVRLYENLSGLKAGATKANPFKDTKDASVLQAYSLGIVGGTSATTFAPNDPVTREQLAVMLLNTLQSAGAADRLPAGAAPAFADASAIAAWAKTAAGRLSAANVMQGVGTKTGLQFQPKVNVSREQIFALANRLAGQFAAGDASGGDGAAAGEPDAGSAPDARTKQIDDEAKRVIGEIIKPGMSDLEKEIAVHDYIVLHTAYDYNNYVNGTVPDDSYSAYGVLFKGTAVCEGYAAATQLLLGLAGIESQIVTGTANGGAHAWNKVKLGDDYYNLDVTWDDPVPDEQGRLTYSYFNVTDEELARDHKWVAGQWPAATATAYNYFEYYGLAVHSADELKTRIARAVASHETEISFKAAYDGDALADLRAAVSSAQGLSGYSYTYNGSAYKLMLKYR